MENKLIRQEAVVNETKAHIELLKTKRREEEDRDQGKLPLNDGKPKK